MGGCKHRDEMPEGLNVQAPNLALSSEVFLLDRIFFVDAPNCVFILPTSGSVPQDTKESISSSLFRHMNLKFDHVISPLKRDRIIRKNAIDLKTEEGRKQFATITQCKHFVQASVRQLTDNYLGIWSQKQIGLKFSLNRASDGKKLWQASDTVSRGDGSFPMSPLSAGVGFIKAISHASNRDIIPSMIDDASRHIVATLPDLR